MLKYMENNKVTIFEVVVIHQVLFSCDSRSVSYTSSSAASSRVIFPHHPSISFASKDSKLL